MPTLWKRATPAQRILLRIVYGSVLNTFDAHGMVRHNSFARSVAKRAAGTLSAAWPSVLASGTSGRQKGSRDRSQSHDPQSLLPAEGALKGDRLISGRRSPLYFTWKRISASMISVKKSGDIAEFEARVRLLKLLNQVQLELEDFNERNNNDRHP